jgi:Winged helix-turn helix
MRKSLSPSELGFNARDRRHLSQGMDQATEACLFRRLQAVLLVSEGQSCVEAAEITGLSLRSVYELVAH